MVHDVARAHHGVAEAAPVASAHVRPGTVVHPSPGGGAHHRAPAAASHVGAHHPPHPGARGAGATGEAVAHELVHTAGVLGPHRLDHALVHCRVCSARTDDAVHRVLAQLLVL